MKSSVCPGVVGTANGYVHHHDRRSAKENKYGIECSANSTLFTTVENCWDERGFEISERDEGEIHEKIYQQILLLSPTADEKTIWNFKKG